MRISRRAEMSDAADWAGSMPTQAGRLFFLGGLLPLGDTETIDALHHEVSGAFLTLAEVLADIWIPAWRLDCLFLLAFFFFRVVTLLLILFASCRAQKWNRRRLAGLHRPW